jgi:8-oxo-dGTP pyrophosphatase MutT (NUDIX family)
MKFDKFIQEIDKIDFKNLPGKDAHLNAMPVFSGFPYRSLTPRDDSQKSAVMILFVPDEDNDVSVILTIRSENLGSHSGQISFPGGRLEEGETALEAALRETHEEIGISSALIEVVAQLSDFYVMPSNSVVYPYIGILKRLPDFQINEDEVQEIILVKLEYLLEKENLVSELWHFHSFSADVPHWKVHKEKNLWGATAMILSEFLEIIRNK